MRHYADIIFGAVYTDPSTVKKVQAALNITVDGKIGPQTRAAVKQFNEARGFPQDGDNITDGTLQALEGVGAVKGWWERLVGPKQPEAPKPAPAPAPSYSSLLTPATLPGPPAPIVLATAPTAPSDDENFLTRRVKGLNVPTWQVMLGAVGALAVGVGVYYTVATGGPRRVR